MFVLVNGVMPIHMAPSHSCFTALLLVLFCWGTHTHCSCKPCRAGDMGFELFAGSGCSAGFRRGAVLLPGGAACRGIVILRQGCWMLEFQTARGIYQPVFFGALVCCSNSKHTHMVSLHRAGAADACHALYASLSLSLCTVGPWHPAPAVCLSPANAPS